MCTMLEMCLFTQDEICTVSTAPVSKQEQNKLRLAFVFPNFTPEEMKAMTWAVSQIWPITQEAPLEQWQLLSNSILSFSDAVKSKLFGDYRRARKELNNLIFSSEIGDGLGYSTTMTVLGQSVEKSQRRKKECAALKRKWNYLLLPLTLLWNSLLISGWAAFFLYFAN